MPARVSRRTLLRVGALPVLGGGVAGSGVPSAVPDGADVRVAVRYPPGGESEAAAAVDALDELDDALDGATPDHDPGLELRTSTVEHALPRVEPDDAAATVRGLEDALYGGVEPPDASRRVDLVLYEHGLPWEQFDELGGAGFALWNVGAPGPSGSDCAGLLEDCRRRHGDAAGQYALAFVNLGIRSLPARALLATLGYDADAMFANTVLHEVAHCFGVGHRHGTVGAERTASPMLTWYCEDGVVANEPPGECCGDWTGEPRAEDHSPTFADCARQRVARHAAQFLR